MCKDVFFYQDTCKKGIIFFMENVLRRNAEENKYRILSI